MGRPITSLDDINESHMRVVYTNSESSYCGRKGTITAKANFDARNQSQDTAYVAFDGERYPNALTLSALGVPCPIKDLEFIDENEAD